MSEPWSSSRDADSFGDFPPIKPNIPEDVGVRHRSFLGGIHSGQDFLKILKTVLKNEKEPPDIVIYQTIKYYLMIDSPSTLPNSRMVTSQTLLSPKLQLSTCDFASMMKDVAKLPPRDVIKSNNYIPLPQTLKFPKGRRIRRATQSNIHDQTHSLQRKISRKMTERSFVDHIRGDNPEQSRRELMSGTFNKNKQPTHLRLYGVSEVQKRTISDLGVDYNRKKVKQTHVVEKRNPITQGDFSKKFSRQQLWKQDRRLRDNGKQAKNVLAWDTSKQTNSYATIHKNCLKSYHS